MRILKICLSVLLLLGIAGCSKKADVVKDDAGSFRTIVVSDFNGEVDITRSEGDKLSAYDGLGLYDGDDVNVASASDLTLDVDSDKHLYAEENTHFWLEAAGSEGHTKTRIHLESGSVLCRIEKTLNNDETFDVNTETSIMSVRGTVFAVNVMQASDGSTYEIVEVFDGKVATKIEENQKEVTVLPGQAALIKEADENTPESFFVMADQIDQESWHSSERDIILISETSELNDPILDIPYEKMPSETVGQLVEMKKDGEDIYIEQEKLERIQETGHEYFEISRVEATCEQDGIRHLHCNLCGNDFDEIIPAIGHSFVTVDAKEATCLESGLTEGSKCENCGKWETPQAVIPALGHNGDPCSRCGETTKTPEPEAPKNPGVYSVTGLEPDSAKTSQIYMKNDGAGTLIVSIPYKLTLTKVNGDGDPTLVEACTVVVNYNNKFDITRDLAINYSGTNTDQNGIFTYIGSDTNNFKDISKYENQLMEIIKTRSTLVLYTNNFRVKESETSTCLVVYVDIGTKLNVTPDEGDVYQMSSNGLKQTVIGTFVSEGVYTWEFAAPIITRETLRDETKTALTNFVLDIGLNPENGIEHNRQVITSIEAPFDVNVEAQYLHIFEPENVIITTTCSDCGLTLFSGVLKCDYSEFKVCKDGDNVVFKTMDDTLITSISEVQISNEVFTYWKEIYDGQFSKPLTMPNFSITPEEDDEEKSELEPINKENQSLNCFEELDGFYYGEIVGVETKNNLEATLAINYYENDELIGTPTITVYRNSATGDISLGKVDEDYMYHNELTTWLSENNKELIGKINEDFVAHTYECFGGLKINTFSLDDKTNSITTSALYGPYILYNRLDTNYIASIGAVNEIQVKGIMIKDGLYTWELLETDKGVEELSSLDQELLTRLSIEYINSPSE